MNKKFKDNRSVVNKLASKRVLSANAAAGKFYESYKKAADIVERAELASGQRVVFMSDIGSTLNFEINRYGISSTTAQKI